ncbi:hypothetical protein CEXT_622331 [Caerostris extrusa]|uniref:Uncharacterized protein n=1 Tax=Caerostris extrusa TaxID=172846 RepID=A0AAV4SAK4_CAEEX|nr:hypothetical protein CEXT_622331 [Caerostris extrusa]
MFLRLIIREIIKEFARLESQDRSPLCNTKLATQSCPQQIQRHSHPFLAHHPWIRFPCHSFSPLSSPELYQRVHQVLGQAVGQLSASSSHSSRCGIASHRLQERRPEVTTTQYWSPQA